MANKLADIYRGDTKRYKISIPGVDLTNDRFHFIAKNNADDADADAVIPQITKLGNAGETGDDPANGVVYITIPSADTALLTPSNKYWVGIQWVTQEGAVKTLITQKIKCLQDINTATA